MYLKLHKAYLDYKQEKARKLGFIDNSPAKEKTSKRKKLKV